MHDEEDIRFERIFNERFATSREPGSGVSLSCRALELCAPIRGVYSELAGTCVDPRAINGYKARANVKRRRNQHTCATRNTMKLAA